HFFKIFLRFMRLMPLCRRQEYKYITLLLEKQPLNLLFFSTRYDSLKMNIWRKFSPSWLIRLHHNNR
ncbi:hypothetical protein DOE73_05425, partial [Paenibacillus dendritiformis]